jgi:FtsP/CotA-like multicopper oxidase with cupredoxin domain/cytochrome oxidase Cu insertion factor (SCO1/SenC/PrrC family)
MLHGLLIALPLLFQNAPAAPAPAPAAAPAAQQPAKPLQEEGNAKPMPQNMKGLSWFGSDPPAPRPAFQEPRDIRSKDGVLKTTLHLQKQTVQAGDQTVTTTCFDGGYTGPTLRLKRGDTLELTVINDGEYNTNIHFHGMQISPDEYGDSVFLMIPRGHQFTYKIKIPEYHNPGIYWYHAHAHQTSQRQVMQGVTGCVIIEGALDQYPSLKDKIKERVMVLHDYQRSVTGEVTLGIQTSWPTYRVVNDQKFPEVPIRPGEIQLLHLSAQSTNLYYYVDFGGEPFWVVGVDGNATTEMKKVTRWALPTSARVSVLVKFDKPGRYKLHTSEIRTGPAGDGYSAENLLTMVCEGEPVTDSPSLPIAPQGPSPIEDLRKAKIDRTRTIVFQETDVDFRIDNRVFDGTRIDQLVKYGDTERWIVRNSTDELHVFHIHQLDFQIVKINGREVPFWEHRDNFSMPVRGEVEIIIPFTRPCTIGDFVFHCHILCHEDSGMMQKVRVYDPSKPMPPVPAFPAWNDHQPLAAKDPNAVGGPFRLHDGAGKEVTDGDLSDGLALMSFGYTNCSGACPRMLSTYGAVKDLLGESPDGPALRYVFVSVDPARDQGAGLVQYAKDAPVPLVAISGTPEEVADVSKTFGAAYEPQPKREDGSYSVRHSTDICLVGPGGRIFKRFDLTDDPKAIADAVRQYAARVPRKAPATASAEASTKGGAE